jgi:S-adenosylmethionine synthetase
MSINDTRIITSECVSRGHPDKIADQISDAILDKHLEADPNAKVACETLISPNLIVVAGEVTSSAEVIIEPIIKNVLKDIGYNKECGFDVDTCKIILNINAQSKEINHAVTQGLDDVVLGAGDQGLMFGCATSETPSFMPVPIFLARSITDHLDAARVSGSLPFLRPDAKSQVSLVKSSEGKALGVDTIVVSTQHSESISVYDVRTKVREYIADTLSASIPGNLSGLLANAKYMINPAGAWTIGGPAADTGLTGRKIVVDNYGADCEIGGGAFSGKDPSKVDRSAAYAARYLAKNIVASKIADKAKVHLAYVIGEPYPVSMSIDTMGTSKLKVSDYELSMIISEMFPMSLENIIKSFSLASPIYLPTARDGHFGVSPYRHKGISFYTWEETSDADRMAQLL